MVEKTLSSKEGTRLIKICLEEWVFTFGFVIPGSTNSWQSVIVAAKDGKSNARAMIGSQFLIETNFYDDSNFVCKKSTKVRYI